jgi:hypothetical protein
VSAGKEKEKKREKSKRENPRNGLCLRAGGVNYDRGEY